MSQNITFIPFYSPSTPQKSQYLQSQQQQQQPQQQQQNILYANKRNQAQSNGFVISPNFKQTIQQNNNFAMPNPYPLSASNQNSVSINLNSTSNTNQFQNLFGSMHQSLDLSSSHNLRSQNQNGLQVPSFQNSSNNNQINNLISSQTNGKSLQKEAQYFQISLPQFKEKSSSKEKNQNFNIQSSFEQSPTRLQKQEKQSEDYCIKVHVDQEKVNIFCKKLLSSASCLLETLKIGQISLDQSLDLSEQVYEVEQQLSQLRLQLAAPNQIYLQQLQKQQQKNEQLPNNPKSVSLKIADIALKGLQDFKKEDKIDFILEKLKQKAEAEICLSPSCLKDEKDFIFKQKDCNRGSSLPLNENMENYRRDQREQNKLANQKQYDCLKINQILSNSNKNEDELEKQINLQSAKIIKKREKSKDNSQQENKSISQLDKFQVISLPLQQVNKQDSKFQQQQQSQPQQKKQDQSQINKKGDQQSKNENEQNSEKVQPKTSTQELMARVNNVLQRSDEFLLKHSDKKNKKHQIEKQSSLGKESEAQQFPPNSDVQKTKNSKSEVSKDLTKILESPVQENIETATAPPTPTPLPFIQNDYSQSSEIRAIMESAKRKIEVKVEFNAAAPSTSSNQEIKQNLSKKFVEVPPELQNIMITSVEKIQAFNATGISSEPVKVKESSPLKVQNSHLTNFKELDNSTQKTQSTNSPLQTFQALNNVIPLTSEQIIPTSIITPSFPSQISLIPFMGVQNFSAQKDLQGASSPRENFSSIQPNIKDIISPPQSEFSETIPSNRTDTKEQYEQVSLFEPIKQQTLYSSPAITPLSLQTNTFYSPTSTLPFSAQDPLNMHEPIGIAQRIQQTSTTVANSNPQSAVSSNFQGSSQAGNSPSLVQTNLKVGDHSRSGSTISQQDNQSSQILETVMGHIQNSNLVDLIQSPQNQDLNLSYIQALDISNNNNLIGEKDNLSSLARNIGQSGVFSSTYSTHPSAPQSMISAIQQVSKEESEQFTQNKQQKNENNAEAESNSAKNYMNRSQFMPLYNEKNPFNYSISNFTVGKKLGHGKFADVFAAFDNETGFKVALKQIKKATILEFNLFQDIINEIKIQSSLIHPNIIKLYGFFIDDESVYLIQELACGKELFAEQKASPYKKFTESQASFFVKQVIEALIYMHSKKVLHRDIKPENIMVYNGLLKLCDFGYAAKVEENQMRKTFCGTLDYVSPEMVQGKEYDFSVDVWSVGILTYELIMGSAPFYGKDHDETFDQIVNGELRFSGPVSFNCGDFITKILERDPVNRISLQECLQHPFIQDEYALRLNNENGGEIEFSDLIKL